jgi:putative transcriptional regulator
MAIATNLKQVRMERNLLQEDLAIAIGSCGRTIGRIERGERNASLELALRLARYLDISVEELFHVND